MARVRQRRQKILWAGATFVLVAMFVFVAAVNTAANLLYLVAGGLISFLILSVVLSRLTLRSLHLTREVPSRAHREEAFPISVRIENRKLFLPTVSLRLENADGSGTSVGYILRIPPRKAAILQTTHTFARRGVQSMPDMMLMSSFPFGLVEARSRVEDIREVVVYPRVRPVRAHVLEQLAGLGDVRKHVSAEGDEFFSLREYVRGDDPRRIAWRSSARLRSLVVKEMESESSRTVTLYFDTRAGEEDPSEESFEECVDLVASLTVALIGRRYNVALVTPDDYVPEADGPAHARRILEVLARVQPADPAGTASFPGHTRVGRSTAHLLVSADQSRWGLRSGSGGMRVVDPREVFRA